MPITLRAVARTRRPASVLRAVRIEHQRPQWEEPAMEKRSPEVTTSTEATPDARGNETEFGPCPCPWASDVY